MITGNVASKKDKESAKSPLKWIAVSSVIFTAVGIWLLILSIKRGNQIAIPGIEKELVINPVLYIFSLILGIALGIVGIVSKRLSIKMQYVIIGAVAGIAFNIVGEFAFGVLTLMLAGSRFYPAVLASAVSLPATLINGVFSIFAAVALYIPLSKAVSEFEF